MSKKLVIVESPAKAKKIQTYLGSNYLVRASVGHIRELAKKNMGIDINNNFKPTYSISAGKTKVVNDLKSCQSRCSEVIIATDADREGEAIGWHLKVILKLTNPKRIKFHEITKKALQEAVSNPTTLDMNLVNAQQGRAILDKLVGFCVSPVLWKHVRENLSAGRVQSVAVRLIVDKENDIKNHSSTSYYKTDGIFKNGLNTTLNKNFKEFEESKKFLEDCKTAVFTIKDIKKKLVNRNPSPPFTTSTLQQEAGRKLRMTANVIMQNAQKLYEGGYITYHRTDSTSLSPLIISNAKKYILDNYGDKYSKPRNFKTKCKNAQEAHEAIRPTDIFNPNLNQETGLTGQQKRIYEIIWKRTIASQMTPCQLRQYEVTVDISNREEDFIGKAEELIFDGFRRVYNYQETNDDNNSNENDKTTESQKMKNLKLIQSLKKDQILEYETITSTEKFTTPPPRYTEPTLIKKMKTVGIGRPSTYAYILEVIKKREYVEKKSIPGKKVEHKILTLNYKDPTNVLETEGEVTLNGEKNKLVPTEIGIKTTNFMIENFGDIMDYKFTSKIEDKLDDVSNGDAIWYNVVQEMFDKFNPKVQEMNVSTVLQPNKRLVGHTTDEKNLPIYAYNGRYGPCLQIGEYNPDDKKNKPTYVSLPNTELIDSITETEANKMLIYPKHLGDHNDKPVYLQKGKYGLYLKYNEKNYNISDEYDKENINLEEAVKIITLKDKSVIKVINSTTKIMNGPYGPYIMFGKGKNFVSIPNDMTPEDLTLNDCNRLLKEYKARPDKPKNKLKYLPRGNKSTRGRGRGRGRGREK